MRPLDVAMRTNRSEVNCALTRFKICFIFSLGLQCVYCVFVFFLSNFYSAKFSRRCY